MEETRSGGDEELRSGDEGERERVGERERRGEERRRMIALTVEEAPDGNALHPGILDVFVLGRQASAIVVPALGKRRAAEGSVCVRRGGGGEGEER